MNANPNTPDPCRPRRFSVTLTAVTSFEVPESQIDIYEDGRLDYKPFPFRAFAEQMEAGNVNMETNIKELPL